MAIAKMVELGKPVDQQLGDAQKLGIGRGVFMVGISDF